MKKVFLVVMLMLFSTDLTHADLSYFRFDDPVGDQNGDIADVVRMDFSFDQATGAYTILLTADASNPFQGDFRININLFNPDAGGTVDPSFFSDTVNDFASVSPALTCTLTGTNARLQSWDIGDRVATSDTPFGVPTDAPSGMQFASAVRKLPYEYPNPVDYIADGDTYAVIVPVPGAVLLGGLGLGFAGWRLKRRTA